MKKIIFLLVFILLNSLTLNKSYANTVFFDDFNGNDGTPLITHNNFWQAQNGFDFGVLSNDEVKSSNGSNSSYYIPSLNNLTDYCVQVDFTQPLPQTFPPDFFAVTTRNNLTGTQFYDAGLSVTNGIFLQVSNGTFLYKNNPSVSDGQHTFKLCSEGTMQSIYIDNNIIASSNDSSLSSGSPGFELGNNTPIDNFRVDTVPSSDLDVPLLKQGILPFNDKNPSWEGDEFDHASDFGGFTCGTTIAQ